MDLADALAVLPADLGEPDGEPVPLTGGITNRNFRAEFAGRSFVLRLPEPGLGALGIDRATECERTGWAGKAGVGPRLVFAGGGVLLTEWVEAPLLVVGAVPDAAVVAVAGALRKIHGGPPMAHAFDPIALATAQLEAAGDGAPERAAEALAAAGALAHELTTETGTLASPVPCHNDLLAGNLLWNGERLWVLDWDYAGMNDPRFDLANFAINNDLTSEQEDILLAAYFGVATPALRLDLTRMKVVSDLREAMWGVAQSTLSRLDFDYAAYASDHLTRLLRTLREVEHLPAR